MSDVFEYHFYAVQWLERGDEGEWLHRDTYVEVRGDSPVVTETKKTKEVFTKIEDPHTLELYGVHEAYSRAFQFYADKDIKFWLKKWHEAWVWELTRRFNEDIVKDLLISFAKKTGVYYVMPPR